MLIYKAFRWVQHIQNLSFLYIKPLQIQVFWHQAFSKTIKVMSRGRSQKHFGIWIQNRSENVSFWMCWTHRNALYISIWVVLTHYGQIQIFIEKWCRNGIRNTLKPSLGGTLGLSFWGFGRFWEGANFLSLQSCLKGCRESLEITGNHWTSVQTGSPQMYFPI